MTPRTTSTAPAAAKKADTDRQALELRRKGTAFRVIARDLGLDGIRDANAAFNRALRLQPKRKQQEIRKQERARLEESWQRAERDPKLSAADRERRLRGVDWHRAQLAAE
jgi:hypothetical protein